MPRLRRPHARFGGGNCCLLPLLLLLLSGLAAATCVCPRHSSTSCLQRLQKHLLVAVAAIGCRVCCPKASGTPSCLLTHQQQNHLCCFVQTILPSMSCSQLAKTGTSVRGMYQAALLSTGAAAGHSSTSISTPADVAIVLDFFQSQLPNQTWLLTYRTAVEQHMQPCQEQLVAGRHTGRSFASQAAAETAHTSSGSSNCATNTANTSNSSRLGPTCTPEHLAEILATIAAMPIQVVQPLPIGESTL